VSGSDPARHLLDGGFLELNEGRVRVSERGVLLTNELIAQLLAAQRPSTDGKSP
jgi:hypothetical protein